MASPQGKQRVPPAKPKDIPLETEEPGTEAVDDEEPLSAIPELMRRAVALGLTGFFTTEEAVRRAVGDTMPKDWTDFLAQTSDRTRSEFLDRLTREIGRVLEGVDFAAVIREYLESRTLTVKAELQFQQKSSSDPMSVDSAKADLKRGK